jgi:uncharacterized membrane protein
MSKKRPIHKGNFQFVKNELEFLENQGTLTSQHKNDILSSYEVTNNLNFVRILLSVGALLLGIGVLTFIASNWSEMGKAMKFFLIILSIIGVNIAGFKLEAGQPKTARTMHYVGILFYGAGIFLIGQTFHLGGAYGNDFLLWALGTIPIGLVLKDRVILVFSTILLFIYSSAFYMTELIDIPYALLVILPLFNLYNKQIGYSRILTFLMNGLSIQFIVMILLKMIDFDEESLLFVLLFLFGLGVGMVFIPTQDKLKSIFELQGHLIHATVGIMLTVSMFWEHSIFPESSYLLFSVLYFLFVLYLVKRGSLFSIVIICALILRFYVDISYDFLPKSMVFIIGGAILIAFGFVFEKKRKEGGTEHVEK